MMIEYAEVEERRVALSRMIGIEDRVWVQIEGCPRVYAIADEDLARETEEKDLLGAFPALRARRVDEARIVRRANMRVGVDHSKLSGHLGPGERQSCANRW
jgi:hypothetical protein